MKKHLAIITLSAIMMGCTTSTYVKLPEGSQLKLQRGKDIPYKEGKIQRAPWSWSSTGGIPYKIEKDGSVVRDGKMKAKFRPASIFWPPYAILYWPMGFRYACNDLTGTSAVECSASTFQEVKSKADNK